MNLQRRLIPTERFLLSIGMAVLITCLFFFPAAAFAGYFAFLILIFSFFLCGCSSSVIFGADSPGGVGYNILACIAATLTLYATLFSTVAVMCGLKVVELPVPVGDTLNVLMLVLPIIIVVSFLISIGGAIFGWVVAQGMER